MQDIIRTRRSVRTFDGRPLKAEDLDKLKTFVTTIENPYGIPVEFHFLDAAEHGLSSPVITGEQLYVGATVPKVPHAEEAFGYSFEQLVLYAWSLGIGTTWIAGTFKREKFEEAFNKAEDEYMFCVSPLGYPASKISIKESIMRKGCKADSRRPASELFFDTEFGKPLDMASCAQADSFEMLRLAPSAVNRQPWRVVRTGNDYHFYVQHTKAASLEEEWSIHTVDLGIGLCHFMGEAGGKLIIENPGITTPALAKYIATVRTDEI
ncbi:MAG: nitroreductase family protein [Firmicutes bacterium]|nr:nitroreductase family protein [Bacillota bacterium]